MSKSNTDTTENSHGIWRYHEGSGSNVYTDDYDQLRYSFLNLTEFLPHATVRACVSPGKWSHVEDAVRRAIVDTRFTSRLGERRLKDYVNDKSSGVDGIVVAVNGEIAFEAYPHMSPDDRHNLASVTKAFVGLLVWMYVERGKIELDAPVDHYIPELIGSGWQGVSVVDVMDHASGIDALEHSEGATTNPDNPYYGYEWRMGYLGPRPSDLSSVREYVASRKRSITPGTCVEYTSINTFVLVWMLEVVAGARLHELVSQLIWRPIGAESDAFLVVAQDGSASGCGGLSATLRDLARFGVQFAASRNVPTRPSIVSSGFIKQITTCGRSDIYAAGYGRRFRDDDDPPMSNGLHWDRVWSDGDFYKGGHCGQGIFVSPANDLAVAFAGCPDPVNGRNELPTACRAIARSVRDL